MSKNIIVFSDGTGQEGGESFNTNVYKLFNIVEDRTKEQIAYYDKGIGVGWRGALGKITGLGISRNIKDCYEFIFDNFESGDQIYLFGFSHGATTMRSLSTFIHLFGMLPKSRKELIKKAYRIYKIKNKDKRDRNAVEFLSKHHTMWCRIKFIGVWDTVAALGIPIRWIDVILDLIPIFKHRFQDLRLSASVENAYHALAIDDERLTFHPTLWRNDNLLDYQKVKQVWFCGMHTDIGGGYKEQQVSDVALEWMIQMAQKHNLQIYHDHKVKIKPDPNGFMHDSRGGLIAKLYRKKTRAWDNATCGRPVIHASVLDRKLNRDNTSIPEYSPWILGYDYDIEPWEKSTLTD